MPNLHFNATIDNTSMLRGLQQIQNGVHQTASAVNKEGISLETMFKRVQQAAAMSVAGFSAGQFVQQVAEVRGQFQQLEIAFKTMIGSAERANALMAQLAKTAATTPFGMTDIAQAAKQLLAYGVEAENINDTLIRLGDISAGLGIQIGDLAYLYGTTMVQGRLYTADFNQFVGRGIPIIGELAKQFGIAETEVKQFVEEGKVGFPEIEKAIISLTSEGGRFGGLMEAQSKSITGRISNIEDAVGTMLNEMGKQSEEAIYAGLDVISSLVENWEAVGAAVLSAAEAIGIYKASSVAITAYNAGATAIGYNAEIAALQQLLPAKQTAAQSDIEQAVAAGTLTEAKAAEVAALREEAAQYVANLQAKAASMAEEASSLADLARAKDIEHTKDLIAVDDAQKAYEAALQLADGDAIEAAENRLNTATSIANSSAKELQAARDKAAAASRAADTAATQANTAQQQLNTASTVADTTAKGIWAQVMVIAKRAQDAFNASMLASPLFWIAAIIAGATYAVYRLVTAETAHEAAVRKTNEAWDEFDKRMKERQSSIEGLIRTIQSETATEFQKAEAYQKLSDLAPELTEQYSQSEIAALDFAKAQKQVNESMDAAKLQEAKKQVDELTASLQRIRERADNDMKYNGGKNSYLYTDAIKRTEEQLKLAEDAYAKLLVIQNEAEKNARPIEVRVQEAEENKRVARSVADFFDKAMTAANTYNENLVDEAGNAYNTWERRMDEFIVSAEKDLADLAKRIEDNPLDITLKTEQSEKQKILQGILDMKAQWAATGDTTIPLYFMADYESANRALEQAKKTAASLATSDAASYGDQYEAAQKAWEAADKKLAEVKKNRSAYTLQDYKDAVKAEQETASAYKALGGDTSNKTAKAAQKQAQDRQKEAEQRQRAQEELNDRLSEMQRKNDEEQISLMREGTEKKIAEIENDYKQRIAEIEKQERELARANKEAGMSGLNADGLTNEQAEELARARDLAAQEQIKASKEVTDEVYAAESQAMRDFLAEYGTYQQKKLAITEDYQQKIKDAETEGLRLQLEKEMQRTLTELDNEEFKRSVNWDAIFGDLSGMSLETLEKLKEQLRQVITTSKDLDPTDAESLYDQYNKISGAIDDASMSFSKLLGFSTEETENAHRLAEEYELAKERYEELLRLKQKAEADAGIANMNLKLFAQGQGVTVSGNESYSQMLNMLGGEKGLGDLTSKFQQLFNQNSQASSQLQGITSQVGQAGEAMEGAGAAMEGAGGSAGATIAMIDKIIHTINDHVQATVEVIDELGMSETKAGEAFGKFAESSQYATDAWESLKSGNVAGVAAGVLGSLRTLGETLGKLGVSGMGESDPELKKDLEYLALSNQDLQQAIENLSDIMEDVSVAEASDVYEVQRKNIEEMAANKQESMQRSAGAYSNGLMGIGGEHSSAHDINEGMRASDWKAISDVVGRTIDSSEDFFNLTSKEMYDVAMYATSAYTKIKDLADDGHEDAAQYMDEYITYWEQLEELEQAYYEKLTSVSYDSMRDEFKSTLLDMESDTADFTENFEKMIQEAIVESLISSKYENRLKGLYAKFGDAMQDGDMSDTEMSNLRSEYDQIVADVTADVEGLREDFGWDSSSTQQSSSSAFQSMSQDTGEELNGRFTAVQDSNERIAASAIVGVEMLTQMAASYTSGNIILTEMRNLLVYSNSYLEDLVKYAKQTYNEFGSTLNDMNNKLNRL